MTSRMTALIAAALVTAAPLLASCSNTQEDSTASVQETKAVDGAGKTASAAAATESTSSSTWLVTPAPAIDAVDLSADPTTDLHAGDTIHVQLARLNPKAGYYTAICLAALPENEVVPICTGGRGDATAQAWIKSSGGTVTLKEDGTADFDLAVAAKGDGIDCTKDACVVKVFGDHTQGFSKAAELPVSFAH